MTSSGHDILVMSGNGHIAQIKIRINVNKLIEVMSSHVSNLTGINNLTADKIKTPPKQFPEPNAIDIPNLKQKFASQTVQYDKDYNVQTKKCFLFRLTGKSEHASIS